MNDHRHSKWRTLKSLHNALQSREELLAFLDIITSKFRYVSRTLYTLDIGFYYGAIIRSIHESLSERNIGHYGLVSIAIDIQDHWDRNPEAWNIAKDFEKYNTGVKIVTGDSSSDHVAEQVREILGGNYLDIVFIDGNHSERGVIRDYLMYEPMVSKDGMICFHDIWMKSVNRAWDQIRESNNWATLELCQKRGFYGIGIIFIGSDNSAPVILGMARYMKPNAMPPAAPMLKTRIRQVSFSFEESARAVIPAAPTGAMGNGNCSTSAVIR